MELSLTKPVHMFGKFKYESPSKSSYKTEKFIKQAGAVLGLAKIKLALELDFYTPSKYPSIGLIRQNQQQPYKIP